MNEHNCIYAKDIGEFASTLKSHTTLLIDINCNLRDITKELKSIGEFKVSVDERLKNGAETFAMLKAESRNKVDRSEHDILTEKVLRANKAVQDIIDGGPITRKKVMVAFYSVPAILTAIATILLILEKMRA